MEKDRDIEKGKDDCSFKPGNLHEGQKEFVVNGENPFPSGALVFAARVTTALTIASLFTLIPPQSNPYPEPVWVFTTACVTSWLPSPDIATAWKKTWQRSLGTCVGAGLGIVVGFMSTSQPQYQALILGLVVGLVTLIGSFMARNRGLESNYSAILSQLTFGVVALSFYEDVEHPWKRGVYRMTNIILGCLIGGTTALVIRPISAKTLITQKVHHQMRVAGVSAQEVLFLTSRSFKQQAQPERFIDLVKKKTCNDKAYKAAIEGLGLWKECTSLFAMLDYDPFYLSMNTNEKATFVENLKQISARSLLIQNSVVMMDTLIRGGTKHFDENQETHDLLTSAGELIRCVLDMSIDLHQRQHASDQLMNGILPRIRSYITLFRSRSHIASFDDIDQLQLAWTNFNESARPLLSLESEEQIVMFFDLLQHVLLRSVRQHYFVVRVGRQRET